MKKVLSFLAIAVIMLGITSCSENGASSPKAAVEAAFKALKSGDAKAMAAVVCEWDGKPIEALSSEDEEEFKSVSALFENVEYTIGDVEYNDEGTEADVTVTMKALGREQSDKLHCFKGEDGKWRVKLY